MGATGIAMPLDLLRELQKISGANDKQMFLRQHMNDQGFLKLLYYAVHPLLTYKVSEATLRGSVQYDPAITLIFTNIFEVCEKLSGMNAIDDVTLYQVKAFLSGQNEQDKELYVKLLSIRSSLTIAAVTKLETSFSCAGTAKMPGIVKSHCRRMAAAKQEGHTAAR